MTWLPRFALAALTIAALATPRATIAADPPALDEGTRRFLEIVNRPIVLERTPLRVTVRENLRYRAGDAKALADVYLPARGRQPAPIVVLVHGGMGPEFPVRPKDWGSYRSWGRILASRGYVAVAYNHRLGYPEPMVDEAASDLDSLLAFARARAREWHGDPDRVAVITYSAGGMLLASALREPRPWLRSAIGFYPIVDLTVAAHLRERLPAEALERHTLGTHLPAIGARMAPVLILRAGRDQIPDLLAGVDRLAGQALQANAPIAIMNHPEAEHGFDNQEPTPRTLAVLNVALGFLSETTAPIAARP